jgi:hypothetical protein
MAEIKEFTPAEKIKAASKYSNKYSWKLRQDFEMARQAEEFLKKQNIFIPQTLNDFRTDPLRYLCDEESGEVRYEYLELIKMIYELRKCNKGIYAMFPNPNGIDKQRISLLGAFHSKHRYSNVWNWKKSKLLRAKIKKWLIETKIHENYRPIHMVLTVPHKNGIWENKRFYASELLQKFNVMRKDCLWLNFVHGGEYGVEVKKSKDGNGLHIHLHCLLFMNNDFKINDARNYIAKMWQKLSGGNIHFESLYINEKDKNGRFIMDIVPVDKNYFDSGLKEIRRKKYIGSDQKWFRQLDEAEQLECYVSGVMECIKYHFKHDCCELIEGGYDIELIADILNNSKGLRFHAKFGALYGDKRLSLSDNQIDNQELTDEELSENIQGEAQNAIKNIVNPYTGEKAEPGTYKIVLSFPAKIDHCPAKDVNAYMPIVRDKKIFFEVNPKLSLNEIISYLAKNKYSSLFEESEYKRYKDEIMMVSNVSRETKRKDFYQLMNL